MADVFPIRPDETATIALLRVPLAKRADFSIGTATIRPSRLLIEGPSESVPLERRMMEVLLAFVDAEDTVLSREDLMERCWPDVIVGEDAVHRAIGGLRKAAASAGAFTIETIPRIGYRLQLVTDNISGPKAGHAPAPPVATRFPRRSLLIGAGAASIASIGLWAIGRKRDPEAERQIGEARIAFRQGSPATDRKAIASLEQLVTRAPANAEAWGLLALARARTDEHVISGKTAPMQAIETAARRALSLDPGNADADAALAIAIPYYGDWLAAEQRFDAVLARHPDHLATQDSRAFLLAAVGRMRASSEARRAFPPESALDANLQYRLIYALWFLNRIGEADRVAARAMEMWPRNPGVWFGRLWVLADTQRPDRALAQIEDKEARPDLPPPLLETLRISLRAAIDRQPAALAAAADRVMSTVSRDVAGVVTGMMLLNILGATDQAFAVAEAYYLESGPILAALRWRPGQAEIPDQRRRKTNMLFTPSADAMRHDPRFQPLVKQMGLADYWDRRGIQPDFRSRL